MSEEIREDGALDDVDAFIQQAVDTRVELIKILGGDWQVVVRAPYGAERHLSANERSILVAALQLVLTTNPAFQANEKPS